MFTCMNPGCRYRWIPTDFNYEDHPGKCCPLCGTYGHNRNIVAKGFPIVEGQHRLTSAETRTVVMELPILAGSFWGRSLIVKEKPCERPAHKEIEGPPEDRVRMVRAPRPPLRAREIARGMAPPELVIEDDF